jgi:hypothetical protein
MTGIDSEKFAKPESLTKDGLKAYRAIMKFLKQEDKKSHFGIDSGGCTTFYSPKQWAGRGERYGRNGCLIICHDGGDVASYFNYDYENYEGIKRMQDALNKVGLYAECCTNWYTAVYPL